MKNEPCFEGKHVKEHKFDVSSAFRFYDKEFSLKHSKKFAVEFCKKFSKYEKLKNVPLTKWYAPWTGWLCRMNENGLQLDENTYQKLYEQLDYLLTFAEDENKEDGRKGNNPQQRMREIAKEHSNKILELGILTDTENVLKYMKRNELKPRIQKMILKNLGLNESNNDNTNKNKKRGRGRPKGSKNRKR